MKCTIELPDLPDGWDVVGFGGHKIGDKIFKYGQWKYVLGDDLPGKFITARRKQSLAEWANGHPDLQVIARMLSDKFHAEYSGTWGAWGDCKNWPAAPMQGTIRTCNGKWIDV